MVDHELSHAWIDEDGQPHVLGHDLEEFAAVVHRHGLWRADIERFMQRAGQMPLFDNASAQHTE